MMPSVAAILGVMPMAIGVGVGAELRQPLGVAVVGGLVVSQLLTLYTIPVTYLYMERFSDWIAVSAASGGMTQSRAIAPSSWPTAFRRRPASTPTPRSRFSRRLAWTPS